MLTHDSIGLGEDGPTHQPVEHLAMLRAMPNLNVFRPADTVETAEAWELALTDARPAVGAGADPAEPADAAHRRTAAANLSARGAYVLAEAEARAAGDPDRDRLRGRDRDGGARRCSQAKGIGTRVVSMPCWELFADAGREVPPQACCRQGRCASRVEAAVRFGWDRWLCGERGRQRKAGFVGMKGFGASGPIEALYPHFGITAEAVAAKAESLL